MDYYKILNISENASKDEIKTAYRKLASKNHPDRGGDTAIFQTIQQAYDVLSDDNKRTEYDASRHGVFTGHGRPSMEDIFNSFGFDQNNIFQEFMRGQRRNPDIKTSINIELKDTLCETTKFINIKTKNNESKTLEIKIPRGIKSGTVMKFSRGGETIFPNVSPGDLYITIIVDQDSKYVQCGLNLETTLDLNCFDAILGCDAEIKTLSGKVFSIKIPPNTQQSTKFKIPEEGLYEFQKDIKGSLYIKINVNIPSHLTSEQLDLIRQIKSLP
jgi:curved DNA-binding protein